MKPFHHRKYRRLLTFVFLAAVSLVLIDPAHFVGEKAGPKVVAFVIDSISNMMKEERDILQLFDDLSHGQVVRDILKRNGRPDELYFHGVDDARGNVDTESYLHALALASRYLREKQGDRIVINISLGSNSPKRRESELIRDIVRRGGIVVAAAGNDGLADSSYPAALDGVICVGASAGGVRKEYSNYGDVNIFADGSYQTTQRLTLPSETGMETHARTVRLNGTSFAAPKVSGLIVKMLRLDPTLSNRRILEILQDTSDDVLGFEQGSMNRLGALAAISGKYAVLRTTGRVFFLVLYALCILALFGVGLLIVVPVPEFLFRVTAPSRWETMKIRRINVIVDSDRRRPRDIKYLIDCLFPGYARLFESASGALLKIGEPAIKYLVRAYPYKPSNEFGDFQTCIYELIEKIGGEEAEEFIRSERERQDEMCEPDSCCHK
jgi:hypothetical protein